MTGREIHENRNVEIGQQVEKKILELIFLGPVEREVTEDDSTDLIEQAGGSKVNESLIGMNVPAVPFRSLGYQNEPNIRSVGLAAVAGSAGMESAPDENPEFSTNAADWTVDAIYERAHTGARGTEGLLHGGHHPVMVRQPVGDETAGIQFELLRTYPLCVAMTAAHPFARLKSVSLEKLAAEPLVGFHRKDYPEYNRILDRLFAPIRATPRIAVECDSASSLITEVEAGRGVALSSTIFKLVAGKRLLYRPLTGTTEVASVGIARATKGDVTPAGEKFCEILRMISNGTTAAKSKRANP
jgi:hypothetical protein